MASKGNTRIGTGSLVEVDGGLGVAKMACIRTRISMPCLLCMSRGSSCTGSEKLRLESDSETALASRQLTPASKRIMVRAAEACHSFRTHLA